MDSFAHVTAIKKANVYYGGKVTSRTLLFADGERKTLGIILPGEYEFGTEDKELMEILAGEARVSFPIGGAWVLYKEGQSFEIPANSRFGIAVDEICDYCCSYSKE